ETFRQDRYWQRFPRGVWCAPNPAPEGFSVDILLVRHAKSEHDPSRWRNDAVRPLSARGIDRQQRATRGMLVAGLSFDEAWVSPLLRAQETLDLILDVYGDVPVVEHQELAVCEPAPAIKALLAEAYTENPDRNLLLVGHNPNMSELLELLGGDADMRTSDLAWIRWDEDGPQQQAFYNRSDLMKRADND
ncbi:MAG: phosphohistidine phosphatase SixA, partial [Rhodothermales bacterium]